MLIFSSFPSHQSLSAVSGRFATNLARTCFLSSYLFSEERCLKSSKTRSQRPKHRHIAQSTFRPRRYVSARCDNTDILDQIKRLLSTVLKQKSNLHRRWLSESVIVAVQNHLFFAIIALRGH